MHRPATIGIDGRFLGEHYPGIGRYVFELIRALSALAPAEELSILVAADLEGRFELGQLAGERIRQVPSSVPPRSWREQLSLPRWARASALDLVHTPFWWSAWRLPCPRVVTLFDLIPLRVPAALPSRLARLVYRLATIRSARRSARILTLSEASRRDLVERLGVPAEKVVVTPAAASERFRPAPAAAIETLRARLALPQRYVLYVGADRPHKNLPRLLAAWREVAGAEPAVCLVLAGLEASGLVADAGRTRERARLAGGSIRCLGGIGEADLPALYSGAELFVLPSLWEGFGLPLVEAMACAAPVACSDVPPLAEVAGGAAALFDPERPAAMAGVLIDLLRSRERLEALATASRRRARELSWERTARATLAVYREVAATAPRSS